MPVDWLKAEWKRLKLNRTIQLTISGCLGPCDLANVACLVTPQGLIWLGELHTQAHYQLLLDWATTCSAIGNLLPVPKALVKHTFVRLQPQAAAP